MQFLGPSPLRPGERDIEYFNRPAMERACAKHARIYVEEAVRLGVIVITFAQQRA
jgi:hypothetical protein